MKAGDSVLHKPSGETWVVASLSPWKGKFFVAGCPETLADVEDVEVTRSCTEEQSLEMLVEVVKSKGSWSRTSAAQRWLEGVHPKKYLELFQEDLQEELQSLRETIERNKKLLHNQAERLENLIKRAQEQTKEAL